MWVPATKLVATPNHDYFLPKLRLIVNLELYFFTLKRILLRFVCGI